MKLSPEINSWRVLAIDDEPDNLHLVTDLLRFRGAQVAGAPGGSEGLELIDSFQPNLILLDLSMPRIDGWEVHRVVRLRPEMNHVPVIALTAHAMPADSQKVKEQGFDGYITKPFRIDSLLEDMRTAVKDFLAKQPPDQVQQAAPEAPVEFQSDDSASQKPSTPSITDNPAIEWNQNA